VGLGHRSNENSKDQSLVVFVKTFGDKLIEWCRIMPAADRQPREDQPRYSLVELVEIRRQLLRYARSMRPGPDRNEYRQVAVSLRRLFEKRQWLDAHNVEGLHAGTVKGPAPARGNAEAVIHRLPRAMASGSALTS
jgi:hypothetical protein